MEEDVTRVAVNESKSPIRHELLNTTLRHFRDPQQHTPKKNIHGQLTTAAVIGDRMAKQ